MEPFHQIIRAAESANALTPLGIRNGRFRCSLYVDDVALFAIPTLDDMTALSQIVTLFAKISGLHIDVNKTEIFRISYEGVNLQHVIASWPGQIKNFPCRCLGLPLHFRKLRKVDFLLLIDKIGSRLPHWKGRFFTSAGRQTLVSSILSAMPTHHLTALQAPKWVFKRIDRFRRSFLWKGEDPDHSNPRDSLINWQTIFRPKSLGGAGLLDLERFSRALRIRWLWFKWKDDTKPWVGMDLPCDEIDWRLFQAATSISVGNGTKTSFWHDNWLQNQCLKDVFPNCFRLAKRKQRSVQVELTNNKWLFSFRQFTSIEELHDLVQLGGLLQSVLLSQLLDDIIWNWTSSGSYSSKSAYLGQFQGSVVYNDFNSLWSAPAEPKMRFFGWLVLHQKTLTTQNLLRRHWPCNWICCLCTSAFEDTNHLFNECPFVRRVWQLVCRFQTIGANGSSIPPDISTWWANLNLVGSKRQRTTIRCILLTTWWNIWLEQNRRIFQNSACSELAVALQIKQDIDLRSSAFKPPWILIFVKRCNFLSPKTCHVTLALCWFFPSIKIPAELLPSFLLKKIWFWGVINVSHQYFLV